LICQSKAGNHDTSDHEFLHRYTPFILLIQLICPTDPNGLSKSKEHAKLGRLFRNTVLAMLSDDAGRLAFPCNWYQRSDTCCRIDNSRELMVMSKVMRPSKVESVPHFQQGYRRAQRLELTITLRRDSTSA
jgi:hypothetical protein